MSHLPASLLIYTPQDSPRLRYVLQWIFAERLGISWALCADKEAWEAYTGPRINYSAEPVVPEELRIVPHALLGEEGIKEHALSVNRWKHSTILFYNQPGAAVPFDLFAAVFYLISRYEEYLPHKADKHGRFPHQASVAAQYSFLQEPVVDQWLIQLGALLQKQFGTTARESKFRFRPSYDVDIAWKYLHKGARRTWGGYLRDLLQGNTHDLKERKAVLSGKQKDPYDCFGWLDALHRQYKLHPVYFLLLGSAGAYDKNADPASPAMQALIKSLSEQHDTGIHPSYCSGDEPALLDAEISHLVSASKLPVTRSRQHYIRFRLPDTYRQLIAAGIEEDYSMGYASANGFRAGTSQSFPWYDLKAEAATGLRVHPFIFMDATSRFYNRHSPAEAWSEWERLVHAVKKVNGTFISIFHNHLLGLAKENKGWAALYERMITAV